MATPPAPTPAPTPTTDAAPFPAPAPALAGPSSIGEAIVDQSLTPAQETSPEPSPYNQHGYYVPTPQDTAKFTQALAAGADLSQMDPKFRASMYLSQGGDPLDSYDKAKTLILDPGRDAFNTELQKFGNNPLGFSVSKIGDAWNWITGQGLPDAAKTGSNVLDWGQRVGKETAGTAVNDYLALGAVLEGQPQKAGQFLTAANNATRNLTAAIVDPAAKGIADAGNLATMAGTFGSHLAYNAIADVPWLPQSVKDAAIDRDDHLIYGVLRAQQQKNQWADNYAGKVTQVLGQTGLVSQATVAQMKQAEDSITQSQMEGGRFALNPLNYVGPGTALHGVGAASKPAFMAAVDESAQKIIGLKEIEASVTSSLGVAQDAKAAWKPSISGDGAPAPVMPPSFDNHIAGLQNQLQAVQKNIEQAVADHQGIVQNSVKQIQTSAGAASRIAGGLSQGMSKILAIPGAVQKWIDGGADWMATRMAGANPEVQPFFKQKILSGIEAAGGAALGAVTGHSPVEGGIIGGFGLPAIGGAMKALKITPADLSYGFSVLGKEFMAGEATSPFWRRVGSQLTGAPQWTARALDNSAFNDVTRTFSAAANAGIEAGGINAGIAGAGSWGNPGAIGQGFISGSILGMAGGTIKTWRDYGSTDQVAAAQVGDRYRFLQSLDQGTKAQFLKLTPELQLNAGSYFSQHPDLGLKFDAPEGRGSYYTINGGEKSGYSSTIHVDPSQPETAIHAQIAHEFNHHLEQRGMASELFSKLLGNPDAGTPGYFTKLDANGTPVRNADGSFTTNDEFGELRARLGERYAASGQPNEVLTDKRVVRELASESAVGRVAPGQVVPRGTLAGKLLDAGTAPFVNKQFVKTALASLGNGFDRANQIIGTGLFTGEKRIPAVDDMLDAWYNGKRNQSPLDSGDPTFITTKDLIGKTDAQIRSLSGAVDAWQTAKDGGLVRRTDGSPILKTVSQLEAPGNKIGKAVHSAIEGMDFNTRHAAGIVGDGMGGYVLSSIEKATPLLERHLTKDQIANLQAMQGVMDHAPGSGMNLRYHPAYRRGAWKQPIPDSLPIKDYSAMPLFTRVTKAGNLLVHGLDHGQLLENAQIAVKKGNGSEWGYNPPKIVEGARAMLETMSKGLPSESVVSPSQKRFLYELTGLDPKVNGQDVFADISRKARSESIYKTFRVDRIHSTNVDGTHNWKLQQNIYDSIKAYRAGKQSFGDALRQRTEVPGPQSNISSAATALASAQAPAAFRQPLGQAAKKRIQEIADRTPPPVAKPVSRPTQPPAAIAAGPSSETVRSLLKDAAPPAMPAKGGNRIAMAKKIMGLETDLSKGLRVETLPSGDGGGAGNIEVAGITGKFDGPMASRLASLIQQGSQKEAMKEAAHYIANQTDGVYKYVTKNVLDKHPGAEFYLRDTWFHQGEGAVKRILARTLGFAPKYLTPERAATGIEQKGFLENLRATRMLYMNVVQNPASNLRQGVANRINRAAALAANAQ